MTVLSSNVSDRPLFLRALVGGEPEGALEEEFEVALEGKVGVASDNW